MVKTPKNCSFVVDRNSIDLYYKIGGFVVDRKSIDLIDLSTKSIRKAYVTINLDGGTITPLIRNDVWSNLPRILKNGGFVLDRRSIDLLTKSIRKASEI